ncbi:MAG: carboxypeptidase-like regulatory domain-containing protein [Candidatus Sulfotelmatobacter sp.]
MFRRRRVLALFLAPALIFVALFVRDAFPLQANSSGNNQSRTYKLEGTVIDSVSGRPIGRALVQLPSYPDRAVLTDVEGEFSFDHVSQGFVEILVTKPGFIYRGTSTAANTATPVQLGPDTGKLILKLTQAAVIYGRVTTKDQQPVESASVEVLAARFSDGRRQSIAVLSRVRSNEDGNFRITSLPPGRYYVAVRPGPLLQNMPGSEAAATTDAYPKLIYYPSTSDLDSAAPLDLAPGTRAEVRFSVESVPSYKFAGFVGSLGGRSLADPPSFVDETGQVLLEPDAFNRQSGAFEFRAVPAGTYLLRLASTDQSGRHSFSLRRITIDANIKDLRLSPSPGVDIPVVVRSQFTQPHNIPCMNTDAGQKTTSNCDGYPAARVELQSFDSSSSFRFYSEVGHGKPLPSVTVGGVVPGTYLVHATPTFGGYIQSIHCGDVDLLLDPLVVSEGALPPIEVAVRDDAASLRIRVRKDKPGQQLLVLAFSHPHLLTGPQMKVSGGEAEFQSGPLPPGEYEIFAFDAGDGVEYTNSDVLAQYASQATSVSVAAGGNASVTVGVIHTGE